MWRLVYAIPTWILFIPLLTILTLVGWVVVPIAVWFRAYARATDTGLRYMVHFTWPFMWLWDNWEDGVAAGEQYKDFVTGEKSLAKQIIYWSCLRNPVNNLRAVPYLSVKLNQNKISFRGSHGNFNYQDGPLAWTAPYIFYDDKIPQWFFAWQGFYTNWYWQFMLRGKLRRIWIGWKIYPKDVYGLPAKHYRMRGAGFALQWKVVK